MQSHEPGQVQRFGEGCGEVWEALVQSQVKFNRVPEKVRGGLGAGPGRQVRFNRVLVKARFRRRSGRLWCRAR